MIHWVGSLDEDLKACTEVTPLADVFRADCGYEIKIVQLDNRDTPPQLQLDKTIAEFVREYDGPCRTHLLIFYYTGHGYIWRSRPNELIVSGTATAESSSTEGTFPPNANWTKAEQPLDGACADTLIILDCCFAGNAMKSRLPSKGQRSYELMAATGKDMPATQPGPRSYTHALINALVALLQGGRGFTTADLAQSIHELRDHDKSSVLYNRLVARTRHICSAPLERRSLPASSNAIRENGSVNVRSHSHDQDNLPDGEAERLDSEACK
ncbi:hypothetical protein LTR35_017255 [Friedmanniomyces endolithicus]|nr:hypothetical protein LTR35_017255 [Friedmanniomyces endolithicus]KAK0267851.1 hypothetical protein LTS00_017717 [Friedmanniomyces endolithicus]KAK0974916.1 hypothetical protein LTR54_016964 [Friedmanniomyces endolithicus]